MPNALQIIKIAKFLDVSSDFLLGLSDVQSTDQATKELCQTLGLSEVSIAYLKDHSNQSIREAIDFLFHQHHDVQTNHDDDLKDWLRFTSMLEEISILISLLKEEADIELVFDTNGDILVTSFEGSVYKTVYKTKIHTQRAYAEVSLLEASMHESVRNIEMVLNTLVQKRGWELATKHLEALKEAQDEKS